MRNQLADGTEEGVKRWNDFHTWVHTPPQAAQNRRLRAAERQAAPVPEGAVYDAQASVQAMMAARARAGS